MITPCVQVCTINKQNVCTGCKRTIKEITNWTKYSPSKRKQIMRELKHRDIHKE
jgi:predicted Fe-S protein YdhL (DUF1289 family)